MNKNNATLIVVGLIALVVGVLVDRFILIPHTKLVDQPAKYVLWFGDSAKPLVEVTSLESFQNALASPVPNWSTLDEVPSPGASPTAVPIPTPVGAGVNTPLVSRIKIIQNRVNDNTPCTMHVTQRVGLNNPDQVNRVLATLQTDPTQ